jgi:hypothetical protein
MYKNYILVPEKQRSSQSDQEEAETTSIQMHVQCTCNIMNLFAQP